MMNGMDRAYGTYGRQERCIWGLVGMPEGKRPLGSPRLKGKYTIKLELHRVGFGGMDWIDLAQDRDRLRALVNAVMNLRVP